ncbi:MULTISPECIES: hypothetical protein [Mycobacterium]|uniref:SRPBCC family protein n=1 Tax=Mycobacterium kiyosense TaxID=2871094 RepID=A0A9P3UVQ1_9MYCO|nr:MULTISPECIES: hypothetical protein [Mycobacterium]BDB42417.1 hypothetical protein IWGMT90018_28630 [Mycobacterium kiyosense]BDE14313.1 hypothetical protein MKCMC460_31730 [Mycobacterium sp. 20KCMC460]GLB81471.1 hypothetical protein SRL2020028_07270 [Mycobacterium kiyosense]GLB90068.1 hypothetical protein SRL2020130_28850 [Mycobacterium kiyosense]GLB93664.1 hypothetical protein SRL2020226_04400 [Mycobacterium kiyosense]
MTQTVSVTRDIKCPFPESGRFVTDPHSLFPQVSIFSRCKFIQARDDGELWDVYLDSGTIQLGGRVLIATPTGSLLKWRSVQGTRHSFSALAEPHREFSRLTLTLTFTTTGLGVARLSEWLGRGLVTRNLEAAAEEIRHHLEFER